MVKNKKQKNTIATRKNPMRSVKKNKHQIASFNNSAASERCRLWLLGQKKLKKELKINIDDEDLGKLTIERDEVFKLNGNNNKINGNKRRNWNLHKKYVDFPCEWKKCHKEFKNENEFITHVINHSADIVPNEDLYECFWDLCGFVTNEFQALTRHLSYHGYHSKLKTFGESYRLHMEIPQCAYDSRNRNYFPDIEDDFKCQWADCERKFNSIIEFFNHVKKEHCVTFFNDKQMICRWYGCRKVCPNRSKLQSHISIHTKEQGCACPHCGVTFKINNAYFDHCVRQVVNNTHEFQCEQCFKYFSTERLLRDHMRMHINCLKCTLCDMSCATTSDLVRHIRYKHLKEKPFSCKFCIFRAVYKRDLDIHLTTHYEQTYECQEFGCNYTCKSQYLLKKHDMIAHGNGMNTYACHCCEQKYNYSQLLSRHLKNKHNFQLPSGHYRFIYRQCEDGIHRLQTTRIESLEVSKQIISERESNHDEHENRNDISFSESSLNFDEDEDDDDGDNNRNNTKVESIEDDYEDEEDDDDDDDDVLDSDQEIFNNSTEFENDVDTDSSDNENGSVTIEQFECDIDDDDDVTIKSIDNFKVMKYLKENPGKPISIDITDVDTNGKVIKSTIIKTKEILNLF